MGVYTMEKTVLFLLAFQLLLFHFNFSECVNLDPEFSLVKEGNTNSYFGFSVAQHQVLDASKMVSENILFVGAPKKEVTTDENGYKLDKKIGGGLYKCFANTKDRNCDMIKSGWVYNATQYEEVSDQWMGVSVASEGPGGMTMGCAHRFINYNSVLGYCASMNQNLIQQYRTVQTYRPCTDGLKHNDFLEDFGLCQAGISATFGESMMAIVGAPGSIYWRGTVFSKNITTDFFAPNKDSAYSPYQDKLIAEEGKYEDFEFAPTGRYSYNGYSIGYGSFDGKKTYYVSGAPKDDKTGRVILYVYYGQKENPKIRYEKNWILKDGRPFSGFGTSVLAVDVNNDGMDELVVGAPYFFQEDDKTGGSIFVYPGRTNFFDNPDPIQVKSRLMSSEECKLLNCQHAAFGLSLSKLGDVNMDGFQDFAVGAPYEGRGAVYIYHGSRDGFKKTAVQRIYATEVEDNLKSFGYSLSGGMDLDENGYPDLLVGAYESDSVVLLRSRPIINLSATATYKPKEIDQDNPICEILNVGHPFKDQNRNCIEIKLCVKYDIEPQSINIDEPIIMYSLEAEKERRVARVELYSDIGSNLDPSKKVLKNQTVTLKGRGNERCIKHYGLVKAKEAFPDRYRNITFTFNFDLDNKNVKKSPSERGTQDINKFPELVISGGKDYIETQVPFVRDCEGPICDSNLQLSASLRENGDLESEDLKLDRDGNYELITKIDNELAIRIAILNTAEPAYETYVYIKNPAGLHYAGVSYMEKDTTYCEELENLIKCDVGNPLKHNAQNIFIIKFDVPSDMIETNAIYNLTVNVTTASNEQTKGNDQKVLKFKVINKAEIYLSANVNPDYSIVLQGTPKERNLIKNEKEVGPSVSHDYIVRNKGPGIINESFIQIHWPYEVSDPDTPSVKYLLYLMRLPKVDGEAKCQFDKIRNFTNPDRIKEIKDEINGNTSQVSTSSPGGPYRRKRESDPRSKRNAKGDVIVFNCKDGSAKCFTFTCMIDKLVPGQNRVKITMESRLWQSTLLEGYSKDAEIQIISNGKVWIKEDLKITQNKEDDEKDGITRVTFKKTLAQAVKWWIILVAVIAGIIVLLVLILIMYKIGFFKRKRQEDMKLYQAEKKHQGLVAAENDDDFN